MPATTFSAASLQLFQLLGAIGRDRDREIDVIVLDEDFGNESEIDDIAFEVGTFDSAKRREHLGFFNGI